jgi:hypothetical protein
MEAERIRIGGRYIVEYFGAETIVLVEGEAISMPDAWRCVDSRGVTLVIPTSSFLREAEADL